MSKREKDLAVHHPNLVAVAARQRNGGKMDSRPNRQRTRRDSRRAAIRHSQEG